MAKQTKSKVISIEDRRPISLDQAVIAVMQPVIELLDSTVEAAVDSNTEHELPSRKDLTLRITLSNICRDVHQQIYGLKLNGNTVFNGTKDRWDSAQNAAARLERNYSNNPEDMVADPSFSKIDTWLQVEQTKFEMLSKMLDGFKDAYHAVTGEEWKYVAPGSQPKKATSADEKAAALARFKAASESRLIKASA